MSRAEQGRDGSRRPATDPSRRLAILAMVIGALMLVSTSATGVLALSSIDQAAPFLGTTQNLVKANVRTLTQTQREILRLELLLDPHGTFDRERVTLGVALVDARIQEGSNEYQLHTLGSQELLSETRRNAQVWRQDIRPQILAASEPTPAQREAIIAELADLELSFNKIVSAGESNRQASSSEAMQFFSSMIDRVKVLVWVILGTFLASLAMLTLGFVLVRRFLTERQASNIRLREANDGLQRYRNIVQATNTMVVEADVAGRVVWVNDAFTAKTGRSSGVVGVSLADLFGSTPGEVELAKRLFTEARPFSGEARSTTRAGAEFWVAFDSTPLFDDEGEHSGHVVVASDITEGKEAETLLMSARNDAEASARERAAFLATMSHEIRTPLNAVLGLTELLNTTDLTDQQREYAETAHRSGRHLLSLLNDILDFSALESGGLKPSLTDVDLRLFLEDAVGIFEASALEQGLELRLVIDESLPEVIVTDQTRMRQVIINLIGNAVKFTSRGSITVSATRGRPRPDAASGEIPLHLSVADTGPGLSPERLSRLFRPFVQGDESTTRRHGGTGLGLSICRQIVTMLGGTIEMESTLGVGSTVHVEVPARRARPLARAETLPPHEAAGHGLSVLVAEDDIVNQTVIVHMLRKLGVEPEVAVDGREALAKAVAGDFDVIMLDLQMPIMDGFEAARRIRDTLGERTPLLVAVSADASTDLAERLAEAGIPDRVPKPVSLDSFTALLARVERRVDR